MLSLEYIAGFFDGEGCVIIAQSGNRFWLVVSLTQRKREILEMIQKQFGGYLDCVGISRLRFSCEQAAQFLKAIQPFVIVKKKEIALALKFQACKGNRVRANSENYKQTLSALKKAS